MITTLQKEIDKKTETPMSRDLKAILLKIGDIYR